MATKRRRAALQMLKGKGGLCERLPWGRAYHTTEFGPALGIIQEYYDRVPIEAPHTELWSCVTADRYPRDPESVKRLAIQQWATTVRMRETVEAMYAADVRVFVEIGPRGNLSAFVTDTLRKRPHVAVPLDLPRYDGLTQLARALGMLVAHGVSVDLPALYERRRPRALDLKAEPPVPAKPDPLLRLDLPTLSLSDEVIRAWQKGKAQFEPAQRETVEATTVEARDLPVASANREPNESEAARVAAHANGGGLPPRSSETPAREAAAANGHVEVNPRAAAFAEYQRTMREFLEVQRRVMSRRAKAQGETSANKPSSVEPASPPQTLGSEVEGYRNGAATPNGSHAVVAGGVDSLAARQEVPMVVAPIPASVAELAPVRSSSNEVVASGEKRSGGVGVVLMDRLLKIVSERTGYPTEMLDVDASLEADLGIDSIKRVEVIGALRREAMPTLVAPPESVLERLAGARTLREMVREVEALVEIEGAASEAPEQVEPTAVARPKLALLREVVSYEHGRHLIADCEFDIVRIDFDRSYADRSTTVAR